MANPELQTVIYLSLGILALSTVGCTIIFSTQIRFQADAFSFHKFLFALRWQTVSCFTLVFSVFRLRFARLNHQFIFPVTPESQRQVELCSRRLKNTLEHLVVNVLGQLALSTYLSQDSLEFIPGLVLLFVTGRVLFFLGFPDYPQLGNLMTVLPTLFVYLANFYYLWTSGALYEL